MGTPNLKEAIDNAIENSGPEYDALIDGVVNYNWTYFIVGFQYAYVVEGTPVQTSKIVSDLGGPDATEEDLVELAKENNILFHSKTELPNQNIKFRQAD